MTILNINKKKLLLLALFMSIILFDANAVEISTNTKNIDTKPATTQNISKNTPSPSTIQIAEPFPDLNPEQKLNMTTDVLYRDTVEGKIDAEGNVVAKFKDAVIYADDIEYYDATGVTKSAGNVRLRDSKEYIRGDKLEYAVNAETGTISDATALSYPWIVKGKTIQKVSKDKAIIMKGKITSCDYEKPDYYFKAGKIIIYFKDHLVAYNVVLYIKGIPIIYLPIMRQTLKDLPVQIAVAVGQNSVDGWYEKIRVRYPFTHDESVTVYVDKYDYRGWGVGLQYDYKNADIKNGSVYGYAIDDTVADTNKRTFRLNHFQKLTPDLRLYTNVNYQSDQYQSSDILVNPETVVNSDIYSYFSMNYTRDLYSMLLVWQRNDVWDNDKNQYVRKTEAFPGFDFTTNTNKISIKKTVQKTDFENLGFDAEEIWKDLVEKGYIDEKGKITAKCRSLSNASELNLKQEFVKKEKFKDLGFNTDEIWENLVEKKYIDDKGKIIAKFYALKNFLEMKLNKKFASKKEQIFNILKNISERNKEKKEKVFPIIKPILNNLFYKYNFSVTNSYNTTNDTYYTTGNTAFSLTNAVKLNKDMTLTPTVGIREIMNNSPNKQSMYEETHSSRLDNSLNLRNRLTRDIDLDFTYYYTSGLFAEKYIIDTNKLNIALNSYFLNGKLKINTVSGYNFNLETDRDVERWDALTTEMRCRFSRYFNSYSKHQYNLATNWTTLLQNILYFYPTAKLSFSENVVFQSSTGDILDTITTIKYRPNLKWKFDYTYRCDYDYLKGDFSNIQSREFAIYRDLHCWEVKIAIKDRLDTDSKLYKEYWFVLNLKALPSQELSLYRDSKYYDKWYYWDVKSQS